MKKVGLYLGGNPEEGGVFQYNIAMLEAVAALPGDQFESVILYSSANWEKYLSAHKLEAHYVSRSFALYMAMVLWSRFGLPVTGWRNLSPFVSRFVKCFLRERCDLWIFPSQDVDAYYVPVPSISTVHDLMHRYEARFPEVSMLGIGRKRNTHYKSACKWSRGILVDSEVGKAQLIESYGVAAYKVSVLPFTPPKYINSTDIPRTFEKRFDLPKKYIFYPAQFWEHKNHKALVRSLKLIETEAADLHLVFAGGKKNAYKSTVKLIAELQLEDKVSILGYVPDDDMPELYRRAVAMMMPTYFGPTNIPPLEAFSCGCPCAVSNIYGMPEQVGDAALLFSPDSDQEISDAMLELYRDEALRSSLAEKGLKQVAKFSQENFNQRLRGVIASLN